MQRNALLIAMTLLVFNSFIQGQSGNKVAVRLEKAKYTMETKGDLPKAIRQFETIIKKYPEARSTAAEAQLYIGICYERLGNQEAEEAYRKVLDKYPEQLKLVTIANENLLRILHTQADMGTGSEGLIMRKLWEAAEDVYAVSPDGRYMTYIDWNAIAIFIYDTKTNNREQITENGAWGPDGHWPDMSRWSPVGNQIAYYWIHETNQISNAELRIYNMQDKSTRTLVADQSGKIPWPISWSSDGKTLLAAVTLMGNETSPSSTLVQVDVQNGTFEKLISFEEKQCFGGAYSPDMKFVAYDFNPSGDCEQKDIVILNPATRTNMPLITHPANDWSPMWSKDGKQLYFLSDRSGSPGLWVINISEGKSISKPLLIKGDLGYGFGPLGMGADGSLYYRIGIEKKSIYTAEIDLNSGKVIAEPDMLSQKYEGRNLQPAWSLDGSKLAYLSLREGYMKKMVFVIRDITTGQEYDLKTNLYPAEGHHAFVPEWTPDNKSLLLHACETPRGKNGFYLIDIKSAKTTPLLVSETERFGLLPQLSPDGETIYYLSQDRTALLKYRIDSGNRSTLYTTDINKGIFYIDLSPDGKFIAFRHWREDTNLLMKVSTSGGDATPIGRIAQDACIHWPDWTSDSKSLIAYSCKTDELYHFSANGDKPHRIDLSFKDREYARIHPDGRHIAFFSSTDSGPEVWAISNFSLE